MENLTLEQKVVVNHEGLDSLPGHVVIVFEKLDKGGAAFSRLLNPGERFQKPGFRLWDTPHKYFSVAVNKSILNYSFEEPVTLDDEIHTFTLKFHLKYHAANPRLVAELHQQDPLRKLRDEISLVVGRSCAQRKWEIVRDRFRELGVVVMNSERAKLRQYAATLGLEIFSIEMDKRIPSEVQEIEKKIEDAEAEKRKIQIEQECENREEEIKQAKERLCRLEDIEHQYTIRDRELAKQYELKDREDTIHRAEQRRDMDDVEHQYVKREAELDGQIGLKEKEDAAHSAARARKLQEARDEAIATALRNVGAGINSPAELLEGAHAAHQISIGKQSDDNVNNHQSGGGMKGPPHSLELTYKDVRFTAYYHSEIRRGAWYTLLVYAHTPAAFEAVDVDSRNRMDRRASDLQICISTATKAVERGTEIMAVPEMPGCRFNPPRASLLWLEDWHRIEFRMQADLEQPGFEYGKVANGRVAFYVGAVLIAEVQFWAHYLDEADISSNNLPDKYVTADPYEAVFVSYSHEDTLIVEQLEKAYEALGIQYMRDVKILRSGEKWNQALLNKIDEADIFQLCWSDAAKRSRYVKQEWRHALALGRSNFIRPTYWQRPMPKPPAKLASLHFAYYELNR